MSSLPFQELQARCQPELRAPREFSVLRLISTEQLLLHSQLMARIMNDTQCRKGWSCSGLLAGLWRQAGLGHIQPGWGRQQELMGKGEMSRAGSHPARLEKALIEKGEMSRALLQPARLGKAGWEKQKCPSSQPQPVCSWELMQQGKQRPLLA